MEFREPYSPSIDERCGDVNFGDEPSLTVQSAAAECDVNLIVDRARKGILPQPSDRVPMFGDFSDVADYQSSLNYVLAAQEMFDGLPAAIRERFGNEPAKLLAFIADASNRDEAIRLGIVAPPVETPTASRSEPASETSSAAVASAGGPA